MINELLIYFVPGYIFVCCLEFRQDSKQNFHSKIIHAICIGFVIINIFDFFDFILSPRNECPYWLKSLICVGTAVILGFICIFNTQKNNPPKLLIC